MAVTEIAGSSGTAVTKITKITNALDVWIAAAEIAGPSGTAVTKIACTGRHEIAPPPLRHCEMATL
jgi:hypothetical protein